MNNFQRNRWLRLFAGAILTGLIAFGLIPQLNRIAAIDSVVSTIKNNDIDAGGLFYSDTEVISEAENYFQFK